MKLVMLGSRMLVRVPDPETKTKSGIIIPATLSESKRQTIFGTVEAVGPQCTKDLFGIGTKLIYDVESATPIEVNNRKYYIVEESDVLGLVEDNE